MFSHVPVCDQPIRPEYLTRRMRQLRRELLPPHTVTQCNSHGALGVLLADYVFVEFDHDFTRREFVESNLFFVHGSR